MCNEVLHFIPNLFVHFFVGKAGKTSPGLSDELNFSVKIFLQEK